MNAVTLDGLSDAYIDATSVAAPPAGRAELILSGLSSCIVNLRGSYDDATGMAVAAVHGKALRRTVLILPPISGSVLLDDCVDCVIVVACHQFRMHATTNTDLYLHVGSMPVIEQCTRIRIAPYPFEILTPDTRESQHFAVQDFDWILPGQSPHWSRMDDASRVGADHWPNRAADRESLQKSITALLPLQRLK